jgi:predicted tellurium resistance membrane protein TerC
MLASIALVELAFAADSLAAIAITDMLFVLVASNLLATAAIRSMSRTIMAYAPRLKPLRMAALGLLALSGISLVARHQIYVTPAVMLGVVVAVLGTGYVMSLRRA